METKKNKYDTNPLDPDVRKRSEEVWGEEGSSRPTQEVKGATREVGSDSQESSRSNPYSEAPTRRYDNPPLNAPYPSVFVPPTYSPPAPYRQPEVSNQVSVGQRPTSRTVLGIGLPEKWAMALPYAPFFIGLVVSLLELFLVPRKEVKVRFHAAQGLSLYIAIVAIETIFSVVGSITGSSIGGTLFKLATTIFLIISMVRVWKGEPHRITPLSEPTQWFNQRIEPRNK